MTRVRRLFAGLILVVSSTGCGAGIRVTDLRINEIVADNEGVAIDESGETEDFIELVNTGATRIWLDDFTLSDGGDPAQLPALPLDSGEHIVFFADGEDGEGERHLPFKLSSGGEAVELRASDGFLLERVPFPPLAENESFARFPDGTGEFEVCRFTSARNDNGEQCGPPEIADVVVEPFAAYTWPPTFPAAPTGLAFEEADLRPEGTSASVVLRNFGASPVDLSTVSLRSDAHLPSLPWPGPSDGVAVPLSGVLAAGEAVRVELEETSLSAIEGSEHFEGVLTLFLADEILDRLDFMAWPEGAVLARMSAGPFRYCTAGTGVTDCEAILEREVPDRLRYLRTPGDFAALSTGGTSLGLRAVKFLVDLNHDAVHLIGAEAYDLHYTFVREQIYREAPLDRCDPEEAIIFRRAWGQYSTENYTRVEGRRFLGGTLTEHTGAGVHAMEFVTGDNITSSQMSFAFFSVAAHAYEPSAWTMRPQGDAQVLKLRQIEGTAPIVGEDAIRAGVRFQPLNAALNYGVLRFVPSTELASADDLGSEVILLTDDVPNDLPLVGGVITEALQTPLAHVNVLSRGRGTPNMALRDARNDERVAPLVDRLVRFEVTEGGFILGESTPEEAQAFWDSQRPSGPPIAPRLDRSVRTLVPLSSASLADVPRIGAKAAQMGELGRVVSQRASCTGTIPMPDQPFAIPVALYFEHFEASGAQALLAEAQAAPEFAVDSRVRAAALTRVREQMMGHPVDPAVLAELEAAIDGRWGDARVRFRSSSNVEDLTDFSGAGLYTSVSVELGDAERDVADGLRTVWASLWNHRAYEERRRGNIDQSAVAMGVLVHPAFRSEIANGIGVSRNILDLTRNDIYYFNVQAGEASVANPAPGVTTDAYRYRWGRTPRVIYDSRSSLTRFDVLRTQEIDTAACLLRAIHDHFRPLLDPESENGFFAMDIEWKVVGDERSVIVKQARPYDVGDVEAPADCRGF